MNPLRWLLDALCGALPRRREDDHAARPGFACRAIVAPAREGLIRVLVSSGRLARIGRSLDLLTECPYCHQPLVRRLAGGEWVPTDAGFAHRRVVEAAERARRESGRHGLLLALAAGAAVGAAILIHAAPLVRAGDGPPPTSPLDPPRAREWRRTWIREATAPLTRRVAFVVDTSGSMRGAPCAAAAAEVATILSLYPDDGRARIWCFPAMRGVEEMPAAVSVSVDGIGEVDLLSLDRDADGWFMLPSDRVPRAAAAWLSGRGSGNTDLGVAVAAVLHALPHDDLSIVVVTDGEPDPPDGDHIALVRAEQERRAAGAAPLHVILLRERPNDRDASARAVAQQLAGDTGGGALMLELSPDDDARAIIPSRAALPPPW